MIRDNVRCHSRRLWLAAVLALLVAVGGVAAAVSKIHWAGSVVSGDGKTVVKYAAIDVLDLGSIGFFSADGEERAVVVRRHAALSSYLSYDGYYVISGSVEEKKGFYLSLYSPKGQLVWELSTGEDALAGELAVMRGAHRAFAAVWPMGDKIWDGHHVLAIDEKGSIIKKVEMGQGVPVNWLGLLWDESTLVVVGTTRVLAFDPEDMRELWRTGKTDITFFKNIAASPDKKLIAILDRQRVEIEGARKVRRPWRVTIIDVGGHKIAARKVLEYEGNSEVRSVEYDVGLKSFVLNTQHGRFRISANGEMEAIP